MGDGAHGAFIHHSGGVVIHAGTPSAAEFLSVWEHGLESRPYERALALLAAACPENSPEELASLTIGQRDALLLRFASLLSAAALWP